MSSLNQFMPNPNLNLISIHALHKSLKETLKTMFCWSLVPIRTTGPDMGNMQGKVPSRSQQHVHTYSHTHGHSCIFGHISSQKHVKLQIIT